MAKLDTTSAKQAAHILVARRIAGLAGDRLPESCRPYDLASAMAVQNAVSDAWCEQMDDSIGAWKCSLPSPNKWVVAPIYTRTIDSIPPVALWPKGGFARVEPELAFFLGTDLPARVEPYSSADIDSAISRTHLALELINSRYHTPADCEFPEMLADALVNQGLFIGPLINSDKTESICEFAIRVTDSKGNASVHKAKHPNGHPRAPLYWLVEFLRQQGVSLMAGQAIITGSYAGVLEVPLNTDVSIEYGDLGCLTVHFTARVAS